MQTEECNCLSNLGAVAQRYCTSNVVKLVNVNGQETPPRPKTLVFILTSRRRKYKGGAKRHRVEHKENRRTENKTAGRETTEIVRMLMKSLYFLFHMALTVGVRNPISFLNAVA